MIFAFIWEALLALFFCRRFVNKENQQKYYVISILFITLYTAIKYVVEDYYYLNVLYMILIVVCYLFVGGVRNFKEMIWIGLMYSILIQTGREIVYGCIPSREIYLQHASLLRGCAIVVKTFVIYVVAKQFNKIAQMQIDKLDYVLIGIPMFILEYSRYFTSQIRTGIVVGIYEYLAFFTLQITIVLSLVSIVWRINIKDQSQQQSKLENLIQQQFIEIKQKSKDDENIRRMYHDMKNIITSISDSHEDTEVIKNEMLDRLGKYKIEHYCENGMINTLLSQKVSSAQKKNIQIDCFVSIDDLHNISSIDCVSMIGNLLDNAIEAVEKETENRRVSIKGGITNSYLLLKVENYYSGDIKKENGKIITTKEDKQNHGIGLQSVKYIVEKYKGKLSIRTENQLFSVTITLPISN